MGDREAVQRCTARLHTASRMPPPLLVEVVCVGGGLGTVNTTRKLLRNPRNFLRNSREEPSDLIQACGQLDVSGAAAALVSAMMLVFGNGDKYWHRHTYRRFEFQPGDGMWQFKAAGRGQPLALRRSFSSEASPVTAAVRLSSMLSTSDDL